MRYIYCKYRYYGRKQYGFANCIVSYEKNAELFSFIGKLYNFIKFILYTPIVDLTLNIILSLSIYIRCIVEVYNYNCNE